MSTLKTVSILLVWRNPSHNNLTWLPDVSRPDRLSSAEITSIVQGAGLQGILVLLLEISVSDNVFMTAVRKNRYVILPVDFEEAWKVSYLSLVWFSRLPHINLNSYVSFPLQQTVKRADDTHEFCAFHHYILRPLFPHILAIYLQIGNPLLCKFFSANNPPCTYSSPARLALYNTLCNSIISPRYCAIFQFETLFHFSVSPHPYTEWRSFF
jgi:hypothetical protein